MTHQKFVVLLLLFVCAVQAEGQRTVDRELVINEAAQFLPYGRMDPHVEFWLPWDNIYRCVYETPLRCDPDSDILRLEPQLLTTLPTVEDDGLLIRMQFRKNIRFHDDPCFPEGKGRFLTAHDFAFALKRHIDPRTKSPYYGAYLEGVILGARRARASVKKNGFFDYDAEIKGIKVIDDYRVELRFLRPSARFPALMTMTWLAMIPREAIRNYGHGICSNPVGTGPYTLDMKASSPELMIFKRHEEYWNRDQGGSYGPLPRNKAVRFHLLKDLKLQEKRFAEGDLTAIDLYPIQIKRLLTKTGRLKRKLVPKGTRLMSARGDKLQYIAFNMRNKILMNKKVRQALSLALNRQEIIKSYFSGHGDLAQHLNPPAIPLHAEQIRPWRSGEQDIDRAKTLLAEAGYPEGKGLPEFILETSNQEAWERELVESMKAQWAKIGVKVQIRMQDWNQFLARARQGLPEISVNYWLADYPDPENFFMMLHQFSWPREGKNSDSANVGFWHNAQYERLYKDSMKLAPGKERGKLFQKMIEIVQDECPWIFMGHQRDVALTAPNIQGLYSRNRFSTSYARVFRWLKK